MKRARRPTPPGAYTGGGCRRQYCMGRRATVPIIALLAITCVAEPATAILVDPFDPQLGTTRRLRAAVDVHIEPATDPAVHPATLGTGWRTPEAADAELGRFWYFDRELLWYRITVPASQDGEEWLSVALPGELVGLFADRQAIPTAERRYTLSFVSIPRAVLDGSDHLYLALHRPAQHVEHVLAGPEPGHFGALQRYTGFRRALVPPSAIEVSHFDLDGEGRLDWQPLDASLLEDQGHRSFAVRFALPDRFERAALLIAHTVATDGVEVWINGTPYYGWGTGYSSSGASATAYRSPQVTVVTLPAGPLRGIQIRRHHPTRISLRNNIRDWQETVAPLGLAVGSAPEMILAQDRGWGFQQTHFVPAVVLSLVAVALLVLGIARSGRGKSTFILLSGLIISGVGAYLGNQMDNVVLLIPVIRSFGFEASRVLHYVSRFAVPPFLLFFFRASTEVRPGRKELLAGRFLIAYAVLFGLVQVLTRGIRIPEGTLVWDMGPLGFVTYTLGWLVAILLIVIHARRSRDPQIHRPLILYALLLLLNALFQVGAAAAPWVEMQVATFVRVRSLLFAASVVPLLAIPIVVYRRVEKGLEDANLVFRRFVPDEFLKFLGIEQLSDIRPGQQTETEMTVMFCDVRGFTSIAESMNPAAAMSFVNSYLAYVGPIIRRNGGFVDKYLGDGVMALFPEDPDGACRAATEIVTGISSLDGQEEVRVGIGLHTGQAMVGTVGEHDRLDTTVISDAVNTASRLQALSARYGASILASEQTVLAAGDRVSYRRFVDRVRLKGKGVALSVHQILPEPPSPQVRRADERYRAAFDALSSGDTAKAMELLRSCRETDPSDALYTLLSRRAEQFHSRGLPADWDGVTNYATK